MTNLLTFSEQLATTVAQAGQSVVGIDSGGRFSSTGIHWGQGLVVTADHALRQDESIRIETPKGFLEAELLGRDSTTDLALLRVNDLISPLVSRVETAPRRAGNVVLAVGWFKQTVTAAFGIISSVSGPAQTWRGGRLDEVIRLDLNLHPAAAGGAIVDAEGRLVGLATPALSRVSVFAVPVSTIARVIDTLASHGRIPRGYLGVGLQPVAIPEHLKKQLNLGISAGLIVVSADADGPAGKAGVMIGDIVVELGGRGMADPDNVQELLDADSIGKRIAVRIVRAGQAIELEITVGERSRS